MPRAEPDVVNATRPDVATNTMRSIYRMIDTVEQKRSICRMDLNTQDAVTRLPSLRPWLSRHASHKLQEPHIHTLRDTSPIDQCAGGICAEHNAVTQ